MVPFWKNTATYIPEQSSHWNDIQASQQSGEADWHRCLPIADLKLSLYSHYNSLHFPQCSLSWQRGEGEEEDPEEEMSSGGQSNSKKMGPKASFSSNKRLWFTSSASVTFYVGVTRTWITFIDTYAHLSYSVKLGETIPSPSVTQLNLYKIMPLVIFANLEIQPHVYWCNHDNKVPFNFQRVLTCCWCPPSIRHLYGLTFENGWGGWIQSHLTSGDRQVTTRHQHTEASNHSHSLIHSYELYVHVTYMVIYIGWLII